MAIRNVYRDTKGLYFKSGGDKFYIASDAGYHEGDKITVTCISCGRRRDGRAYLDFMGVERYTTARSCCIRGSL